MLLRASDRLYLLDGFGATSDEGGVGACRPRFNIKSFLCVPEPADPTAVARSRAGRRGYGLEERERDDRDDEIARLKSKVGEITMDNELLNAKIAALEGKRPLAHRGRDDEPDALALQCSLLWLGARCARVVGLACQRLSLPQRDPAEHDRPSPWPGRACSDSELAGHIRQQSTRPVRAALRR